MSKKQYCFNCGEFLGEYNGYGDLECCGSPECDRAYRDAIREEQEEAQERARQDNFERYRR